MLTRLFRIVLRIFFREITVSGLENLPAEGPVIFTPNHPNALVDPLLLFMLPARYRVRFVAKAPLFKIPLLGWLMGKMGVIPVIRPMDTTRRVDYRVFFRNCLNRLQAGESIVIFPEGVSRPLPRMAALRTGAARLFCMAKTEGLPVSIVPVGINYEQGALFRSSVMVSFGRPLVTKTAPLLHEQNPREAARLLTRDLACALGQLVFQADNIRERELMLLLERIYRPVPSETAWPQRLSRLKEFAAALSTLRRSHPEKIRKLRNMLVQYRRGEQSLQGKLPGKHPVGTRKLFFQGALACCGFPLAALGWMLTVIPYRLCRLMVTNFKKCDAAATATYKIVYALLLFPLAYLIQGFLVHLSLGGIYTWLFALLVIPLSYFTLFYFEWLARLDLRLPVPCRRFQKSLRCEVSKSMALRQKRIIRLAEHLYDHFHPPAAQNMC